jgi:hypothetical protein
MDAKFPLSEKQADLGARSVPRRDFRRERHRGPTRLRKPFLPCPKTFAGLSLRMTQFYCRVDPANVCTLETSNQNSMDYAGVFLALKVCSFSRLQEFSGIWAAEDRPNVALT